MPDHHAYNADNVLGVGIKLAAILPLRVGCGRAAASPGHFVGAGLARRQLQ